MFSVQFQLERFARQARGRRDEAYSRSMVDDVSNSRSRGDNVSTSHSNVDSVATSEVVQTVAGDEGRGSFPLQS